MRKNSSFDLTFRLPSTASIQSLVGNLPHVNKVISETSEQLGSILVPGQTESSVMLASFGHLLLLGEGQISIRLIFVTHQVPDLHTVLSSHAHPLQLVVEKDLVHFSLSVNRANGLLEVSHIPEVENLVLASGGQIFGIGGNSNGVDLTVMGLEGVSDLEVDVPDLKAAIPSH